MFPFQIVSKSDDPHFTPNNKLVDLKEYIVIMP